MSQRLPASDPPPGSTRKAGPLQSARISSPGFLKKWTAVGAALAAALIWSTSFVVTKIGVNVVPPLTFGALRFAIAGGLLAVFVLLTRRVERPPARDLARLALGGLLGITAYFSLQNLGVQLTSAAEATLLVASFPAVTMLLEVIFFRKRVGWVRFLGVGVAMLGVYLIIIRETGGAAGNRRLQGDLFLLATGLAWTLYNFATQEVVQRYTMFTVVFWQTLTGALAFLPLALLEQSQWVPLSLPVLLSAAYLGVVCSIAAFLLYGRALKGLDPGSTVSLMNLVPVFGLGLAVIALGERISPAQGLGGLVVLVGVMLSVRVTPGA